MKYKKQISVGYDVNGKRIRKWISADSQQELKRKEKELLIHADDALSPDVRFGNYAEHWVKTYKGNKEAETREWYETAMKKFSSINRKKIKSIRRSNLQEIIQENWEHPRTCEQIEGTLKQIFRAAIADGLILRNPAEFLELPKRVVVEKRTLTAAEKDAIRNAELPPAERLFLDLERQLGLRPEEARALTRSDINFDDGTLTISRAVVFAQNRAVLKDTKNLKHRALPLNFDLLEALRIYVRGVQFILFPGRDGQYMTKAAYRMFTGRIFAEINRKLGGTSDLNVLNGMTCYTMRHTKGTELYYLTQQGKISTKMAAYYMGHSEVVFLSTYSHIDSEKEDLEALRNAI